MIEDDDDYIEDLEHGRLEQLQELRDELDGLRQRNAAFCGNLRAVLREEVRSTIERELSFTREKLDEMLRLICPLLFFGLLSIVAILGTLRHWF